MNLAQALAYHKMYVPSVFAPILFLPTLQIMLVVLMCANSVNVIILNIIALLVNRCYEDMPLQELQATQEQRTIQNLSDTLRTILRL
jgi:predicted membrane metal-binding protein